MFTITNNNIVVVSQWEEEITRLGICRHERYKIITDFQGVIDKPVISKSGDWVYFPFRKEDEEIIPKAAYRRHAAVEKAGYKIAQVVIGHDIKPVPQTSPLSAPRSKPEIDWGNVADVAGRGLMVGIMGIVMVPLYALAGVVMLLDPSYCIVLDNEEGSVIELLRWSVEA